jgi:hypothetical protein
VKEDEGYGILLASFFDGETGRALQSRGDWRAMLLGAFLSASRHANMIGLYPISLQQVDRALPILKGSSATRRAFGVLADENYAFYDLETEYVWVREMARVRLSLDGTPLSKGDRRRMGAERLYMRAILNPYLSPFYDRYHIELGLTHRRGSPPMSPHEGDSHTDSKPYQIPIPMGSTPFPQTPYPNQDQVPEISDQVPGTRDQVPEKKSAAAAPRLVPKASENPADFVENITTLVAKDFLPYIAPNIDFGDLTELVKQRCTTLRIPYDGQTVRKAIESAQYRAQLKRRMS